MKVIQLRYDSTIDFFLDYARDISKGTLTVQTGVPLKNAELLAVEVFLPGEENTVTLSAKVDKLTSSGGGVHLQITNVPDRAKASFTKYLASFYAKRSTRVEERRSSARFRHTEYIELAYNGSNFKCSTMVVSQNALQVIPAPPWPAGAVLDFALHTGENSLPIQGRGVIDRFIELEEPGMPYVMKTAIVEICHIKVSDEARLDEHLDELAKVRKKT